MEQEKTTFTCPFGTYVYRRMPFGLCNAPAIFQRCMLAIFHDMIEESVEVFMDNFFVFGNSFDKCLNNLDKILQHCKDAHLVLNWEKCHFMVKERIVLGHKVSSTGLVVDKAKINVISKLPPHTNIKGVKSFLGHAGFYRRFIKDFSKIARPLTKLLEKDTPFKFDDECRKAFELLKEKLTCAPVIVSPNWNLPFELMCDASDFTVGAVYSTENVVANHLSRIDNSKTNDDSEVDDNFPGETLMEINTRDEPWFADFANYLEETYLFKVCSDESHKFKYILVTIDYVSKWAEAKALPTNDARVVVTFLKKLFRQFRMPKALISDRGTCFCNKIMEKTMKRYGVSHHLSTSYHPQISSQVENINRALKRIIEKIVKDNSAIWSRKLDDALWDFCTTYKTPTSTTPYKLIYGKNYHLPFEIEHRAYWALKNCNPSLIAAGEK
ncbi:reverse transcriptase domain-containing protein [Tanacetum coccineum]